ncbi:3-isopropylmalate dehydratase small subunit [Ignatzschineria indica]|uniref:3-isopropylmalate dehydratase small subunit n=1 Tax=Ignatzschineria TaxID=112008 RepID=UPI000B9950A3|nr:MULTISPECIES: 3-isopropylmalate dehydratase small subunit [Ignatzschineria]MDM1544547.1 3-isopropylmalate dehydratase small subunit [Ignatzschineria indica]OYQ78758.1 3-isopropylmalate dehydratase small subunit [Ignatzschineria sp. F8392]
MQPFVTHTGIVVPLDRANVDTDAIIPKQFLTSIYKTGFGPNLFDEWRYLDRGAPGMDNSQRPLNMEFPLNKPQYEAATILLARDNFGCGSSREHAVWALTDYGFRAVISTSYSDIFFNNCFKNGFLPIRLTSEEVEKLFQLTDNVEALEIAIDLPNQSVTAKSGEEILAGPFHFEIDPFRKHCLVNGLDDISLTLEHQDEIRAYEKKRAEQAPWLFRE